MAQFDVHRNPGKHGDAIPFAPLVKKSEIGRTAYASLNPSFTIEDIPVVLHPLEIVSVPADILGAPIGSLSHEGERIMAALDELLTQAWK